jgi:hypothetical protein
VTVEPIVAPAKDQGVGSLFAALAREASRLIRQEMALARTEMIERLGQAGAGAASLALGGLVLFAGLLGLMAAAVLALALVLPAWAAALIVGGIVFLAGIALLLKGRHDLAARNLVPRRTVRSLREDAAWAKEQMR